MPGVQIDDDTLAQPTGPFITVAAFWITGTGCGILIGGRTAWLIASVILLIAFAACLIKRIEAKRSVGLLCTFALAASWAALRTDYVRSDHIAHYVTQRSQLARITGTVASRVNVLAAQRGAFSRFSYEPPATMFSLAVETLDVNGQTRTVSGTLLAKIEQADARLQPGNRVQVIGWLAGIDGPYNPSERDFRKVMAERGIDGRITMRVRGNCRIIEKTGALSVLDRARHHASEAAAQSLRISMTVDGGQLSFLEAILLGRRNGDLQELRESFRQVGLAHLLSISGAHLGILLFIVWMVVRYFVPHPTRATLIVLVVLLLYLMAVPLRVPIVRAGIMAGLICVGFASGRRVRAVDMIALSAIIVLIWRPIDLFSAGFQLSFGIVAGLVTFTKPVSQWLWQDPLIVARTDQARLVFVRWMLDYAAVNVVAFFIAFPLVAFHFQIISPLAILLSILAFPVVTVLLGLGYLKIIVGLILPSAGVLLAGPMMWIGDTMTGLVQHATTWPAATINLGQAPSILWTIGTLALVLAMLRGWFAGRKPALVSTCAICLLWLALPNIPATQGLAERFITQPALKVNMFAVGDGSCFLVRVSPGEADSHTLMFDCGSQAFFDTGIRTIAPGLKALGVSHIDTLFLSHADLDHFSGVLDMLDEVTVGRVLVPPQLLVAAEKRPTSTAGFLVTELRARGLYPSAVHRGWSEQWADAEAALLWPPDDFVAERANDTSLVLSIRVAGRRLLLNGDIAKQAVPALLNSNDDLNADVTDLPHHGSFIDDSPRWLEAVSPTVVLQSSGPTRLENDKWTETITEFPVTRLVTAMMGMIELQIESDGRIHWSAFRDQID